jgi:2-polyprenyl-3-methyl-5-hydroxy-6-metoxy-1,4-benzoquinol methylase
MSLREIERASIIQFLADHQHLFNGKRVLDYGCGRQPYRDIMEQAGGDYFGYDRDSYAGSHGQNVGMEYALRPGESLWDVIVCTQVLQYVNSPRSLIEDFLAALPSGGVLLMTGPTNWPIVEVPDDKWRFTPSGINKWLYEAGFRTWDTKERAHVTFEGERWCLGWSAKATA